MSIFATFNPFYEIRYPRFSTNVYIFVSFLAHVPLIGHKFILASIKINDFINRFGCLCNNIIFKFLYVIQSTFKSLYQDTFIILYFLNRSDYYSNFYIIYLYIYIEAIKRNLLASDSLIALSHVKECSSNCKNNVATSFFPSLLS